MNLTLRRVPWTRRLALAATTGLLSLCALMTPDAASADVPFPEFRRAADGPSAAEYWTPERMRSAQPPAAAGASEQLAHIELPQQGQLGGDGMIGHQTDVLAQGDTALHPHASIGKVFFTLDDFDHICSASAVTSHGQWGWGSGQLVITAGHCLNNGDQGFASNFVFAPGYYEGVAPLGLWEADRLFTTHEWHSGQGIALGRDVGFAVVRSAGEYHGTLLHEVVEPLNIAFTESYPDDGIPLAIPALVGGERATLGYGELNWGGEVPVRSVSQIDRLDNLYWPETLGMPSTHTGGASGGPWIYEYEPDSFDPEKNILTGVNSYVYGGVDRIYSPQFDSTIHDLWAYAAVVETVPEPSSLTLLGLATIVYLAGFGDPAATRRKWRDTVR